MILYFVQKKNLQSKRGLRLCIYLSVKKKNLKYEYVHMSKFILIIRSFFTKGVCMRNRQNRQTT